MNHKKKLTTPHKIANDVEMKNLSDNESIKSSKSSMSIHLGATSTSSSHSTSSLLNSSSSFSSSSSSMSSSSSSLSDDDIIPLHDQKSKLKVFEKIIALISFLSEQHSNYIHNQHHNFNKDTSKNMPEKAMDTEKVSIDENNSKKNTHKLNLNFFYKSILDKTNLKDVVNILFSLMRMNLCNYSHMSEDQKLKKKQIANNLNGNLSHTENQTLAEKFVNMCCKSIKRLQEKNGNSENERCAPFFRILSNFSQIKSAPLNSNVTTETDLEIIETTNEVIAKNDDCPSCVECQENNVDFTCLIIGKFSNI